jgi:hypothetical protein
VVEGGGGARKPPAAHWIRRHVKRAPPPAWISPDLDRRHRGRAASVACSFDSLCSPATGRAEARHGCGDRGRRGRARAVAEGSVAAEIEEAAAVYASGGACATARVEEAVAA